MAIDKAFKQLQQEYNENLAKELGYDNFKAMKNALSEKGSVQQRLESGQGFGEAITGATKEKIEDVKDVFSKRGLKRFGKSAYMNVFGGDDILSAYMRGRLNKKTKQEDVNKPETKKEEEEKPEGIGKEGNVYLKIIAKESMSLPGMARDTNVLRQNLQKLVKLWGGEKDTGADAHFLKSSEREEKLEVESEAERAKDLEFFKKEDERESELEKKETGPTVVAVGAGGEEKDKKGGMFGGLLDSIMGFFKNGLLGGLTKLFNPMAILKLLGKVFVIATILVSLFKGITAAFDRWKETGSLKEAVIAGLGAIVDFLTFGFFGEDSVRKLFDSVGSFIEPIIDTIKEYVSPILDTVKEYIDPIVGTMSKTFDAITNWIGNNVGIPKISIPLPDWATKLGAPKEFSVGPYYPFKSTKPSTGATGAAGIPGAADAPAAPVSFLQDPANKVYVEQARKELAEGAPGKIIKTEALEKRAKELKAAAETARTTTTTESTTPTATASTTQTSATTNSPLKLPKDVTWDPDTGFYTKNGVRFSADTQDVLDEKSKTFDTGKSYKWEYVVPGTGQKKTEMFNGAELAGKGLSPDEQNKPSSQSESVTPSAGAVGAPGSMGATGSAGSAGTPGVSAAAPEPTAPAATPASTTGTQLASASADIAEKQRMESSAEQGTTVNNSTMNNSTNNREMEKRKTADVYDTEFLRTYAYT
jgi:hypothetical protein